MRRIYKTVYEAFEDFVERFNLGFLIFFSTCVSFMTFEFIFVFFLLISYWINDSEREHCNGQESRCFFVKATLTSLSTGTLNFVRYVVDISEWPLTHSLLTHYYTYSQPTTHRTRLLFSTIYDSSVTHDWTDIYKTLIVPFVWMDRIYCKSDRRGCQRL